VEDTAAHNQHPSAEPSRQYKGKYRYRQLKTPHDDGNDDAHHDDHVGGQHTLVRKSINFN
jgi:hypothetical protein